jgi:hypothetical protein
VISLEIEDVVSGDGVAASGSSLTRLVGGAGDNSTLVFEELAPEPSLIIVILFFRSASNSAKFGGDSYVALPAA